MELFQQEYYHHLILELLLIVLLLIEQIVTGITMMVATGLDLV